MQAAADLFTDLSRSFDATIERAAHRNEIRLAWIRAVHITVACVAVACMGEWPLAIAAAFWTAVSWGLVRLALRHGQRLWIPWAATFVDLAMILTFRALALLAPANALLGLAGSAVISTLMAMTGALRLTRSWVWLGTAVAASNLAFAALSAGLSPASTLFLLLLLFLAGLVAQGMSGITREAVENEVRRVLLQRFLPKTVIDAGSHASLRLLAEPRSLDATVLISDIRSFTAFAEELAPAEVLALLNRVQGRFAEIVKAHGGTVDKFMGDGMLAVFGAPDPSGDHAQRAVAAAEEMLANVAELDVRIGIGVHSGRVVTGCLGSGARLEFTVIGDTVNIASRLEAMTKEKRVAAILSHETVVRAARPLSDFHSLGSVAIRGRVQPLDVHTFKELSCTTSQAQL